MMIIMWTCLQTQLAKQFFVRGRKSTNCGVWVEIISSIGEELEVFGDTAAAGCCQVISWRCELSGSTTKILKTNKQTTKDCGKETCISL